MEKQLLLLILLCHAFINVKPTCASNLLSTKPADAASHLIDDIKLTNHPGFFTALQTKLSNLKTLK